MPSAESVHPEDGGTTFFQMLTPISQTRHSVKEIAAFVFTSLRSLSHAYVRHKNIKFV
jgi:hypothetical protein